MKLVALLLLVSACEMESTTIRDIVYRLAPPHEYTCTAMRNCEDQSTGVVTQTKVTGTACTQTKREAWLDVWQRMDAERPECGHVQVGRCTTRSIADLCLY